jgi:uncharacterized membrane protein
MFQTHCYDAWLGGAARNSKFFMCSQMLGTFPAPLFLFLAGISLAIVVSKLLEKDVAAGDIARKTIRRGAEIFALGLLFRLQEFAIAWGWAPRSDLFRVDILNTIGVSIMLMGAACWAILALRKTGVFARRKRRNETAASSRPYASLIAMAILSAAAISAFTPLLWTIWRPDFLPWQLESYIDGVHNIGHPQSWLFPIFPWSGFAFAGLALGFVLINQRAQKLGAYPFFIAGGAGVGLVFLSKFVDSLRLQIYPIYDYWHTSPEFFMARVGMLLLFVLMAYTWCRWGFGQRGFSPLIQLGRTSLLVYWVHIEFMYGRFTILPHQGNTVTGASAGLLIIFLSMLALSLLRTTLRGKFAELVAFKARTVRPAQS